MKQNKRIVIGLSVLVTIELVAIILLCFRNDHIIREDERLSQRYSDLYIMWKKASEQNEKLGISRLEDEEYLLSRYRNETIRVCPHCGGDVLKLIYGLIDLGGRDSVNYDLSGRMRYIFARCEIREAEMRCVSCGREYRVDNGTLRRCKCDNLADGH